MNDNGHTSIVISCDPTQGPKRKKVRIHGQPRGKPPHLTASPLFWPGLASRADRLALALLFQSQRPLEHREGGGLGLPASAFRLDRLLGHELRPGGQHLLWSRSYEFSLIRPEKVGRVRLNCELFVGRSSYRESVSRPRIILSRLCLWQGKVHRRRRLTIRSPSSFVHVPGQAA